MTDDAFLQVQNLTVRYATRAGEVSAVENVSLSIRRGEALGLAGESGCGKTTLAMGLLKLLPDNGRILQGRVLLEGRDLLPLSENELRPIRWRRISIIFQAAMNSLNPVYRVGDQVREALDAHFREMTRGRARERTAELFRLTGLDSSAMDRYPHQLSGGMRQRAVIALALACDPDLVIADEPTSAVDVIMQDSLLREIRRLQKDLGMSLMHISHDLAVLAEGCQRIAVMYAGRLAEVGATEDIFDRPRHPYTQALIASIPNLRGPKRPILPLPGEPPDLLRPPAGCRFHPRCPRALEICSGEAPAPEQFAPGHLAACWNPVEPAR